mmetsp:Transcript_71971/g.153920  ORF Transcript_71971/g.153920 Transcript_71971/m.153920 type:complete len:274 (+) Transcript_71971:303-1124(+)
MRLVGVCNEDLEDVKCLKLDGLRDVPEKIHVDLKELLVANICHHDLHETPIEKNLVQESQCLSLGDVIVHLQQRVEVLETIFEVGLQIRRRHGLVRQQQLPERAESLRGDVEALMLRQVDEAECGALPVEGLNQLRVAGAVPQHLRAVREDLRTPGIRQQQLQEARVAPHILDHLAIGTQVQDLSEEAHSVLSCLKVQGAQASDQPGWHISGEEVGHRLASLLAPSRPGHACTSITGGRSAALRLQPPKQGPQAAMHLLRGGGRFHRVPHPLA